MANTYTLIASNVLASSQANVTFSSIPGTYTDLVVRFNARSTYSYSGPTWLFLTFNGATTGFSTTLLENAFNSSQSQNFSSTTTIYATQIACLDYSSNTFGTGEFYIPSYTVSQNKPVSVSAVLEQNTASGYLNAVAGSWANTAAITSITMTPEFGSVASNSSFYLYGIKNS